MRLFRCAAADLRLCMGFFFFFGLGRNQDHDRDWHKGTDFSAPRIHVDSHPAVSYQFSTGDWRGAMSSLASKVSFGRAGVVERGDQVARLVRVDSHVFAGGPWESGRRGRCKY